MIRFTPHATTAATVAIAATVALVLLLAGCGDEPSPPASISQPSPAARGAPDESPVAEAELPPLAGLYLTASTTDLPDRIAPETIPQTNPAQEPEADAPPSGDPLLDLILKQCEVRRRLRTETDPAARTALEARDAALIQQRQSLYGRTPKEGPIP